MKIYFLIAPLVTLLISCTTEVPQKITSPNDYNSYLSTQHDASHRKALEQKEFWSKRLRTDTSGVGDIAPLAGAYEQLFTVTGNTTFLYEAEQLYKKGIAVSANNKDGFARGLAHNYITQHRFKAAYDTLQQTLAGISNKHETQLMLFDAAMEVGAYEKAHEYLNNVKNLSDYNYLIRLSKWSDYKGDLDSAIRFMEAAKAKAESKGSIPLRVWTYSNLADYYGHAGRIKESYEHYLMTLKLQPDNSYVKKGIAWVVYSAEKNTQEAHRILDSVLKTHPIPDYYLLKSELYAYEGYDAKAETFQNKFIAMVENGNYGDMYNAYLIEFYSEKNPSKALQLAQDEINNRATPETYHLLALSQLKTGAATKALETVERYVADKTSEPMALFHSALVYRANGLVDKVDLIKTELLEARYELGPYLIKEIEVL